MKKYSLTRIFAFMKKESLQVIRDPSSLIIAGILPLIMIFLFAFGVSLDTNTIRLGLVMEDTSPLARSLAYAFMNTPYFKTTISPDRAELTQDLVSSKIRGFVVIPSDFSAKLGRNEISPIQIIADGSETNTASFVQIYSEGVVSNWWASHAQQYGQRLPPSSLNIQARVWFNADIKSRDVILPGSIAIILALIGTLLTALVVAREWERGSMEAILSTPIRIGEFIIGKITPYFTLGMGSMLLCVFLAIVPFKVPFMGSFLVLILATAIFLLAGLSQGLLISILSRNQFVASQAAINAAFLPAYMLSGFLYEIQTMPLPLRILTYFFAPRYYVSIIQTNFLAGVVWERILPDMLGMLIIGVFFLSLVIRNSKKSLE